MTTETLSEAEVKILEETDAGAPPAPAIEKVKVGNATMLNRFIDPEQVKADLSVNQNDLDDAMLKHASLYVHYATQTVNARRQYDRLKQAFEILEARLDGEFRASLSGGTKKPTEGSIRSAIVSDKRWSGAQAKVIDAGSIFRLCEAVENGMCHRKDLVLELARDRRKEKEGQVRVMESQDMRDRVLAMVAERTAA